MDDEWGKAAPETVNNWDRPSSSAAANGHGWHEPTVEDDKWDATNPNFVEAWYPPTTKGNVSVKKYCDPS